MNIVVVGIGGIGSHLVRTLCRFLNALRKEGISVTLIDGDRFETKNEDRQEFWEFGNKAEVLAQELSQRYPRLGIVGKPWYVSEENAFIAIHEGDIVFSCPDNHATRNVVQARCSELDNVMLISGGNSYTTGSVQVCIRQNGNNITPPITYLHPEIEFPKDKNPAEMSCEELAQSGDPQLIFTNFLAAGWMLTSFWKCVEWIKAPGVPFDYSELYFDGKTGNARSVNRTLTEEKGK